MQRTSLRESHQGCRDAEEGGRNVKPPPVPRPVGAQVLATQTRSPSFSSSTFSPAFFSNPRVFIGGRHIGGADEIVYLQETGKLKKIVQWFPMAKLGACSGCGGVRLVLCFDWSGSRKVYLEEEEDEGGFRMCFVCNENGLIRCPSCC
ncbi:hypothetical protein MRB53_023335 [Persea americana]|uniref:Uncharacterized protein n=1 Tax=Persea americana TaxID=3435 RepID=A0ACC2L937_PERAE|nr:hypothetical protein MRB53_023335 [Persea americana]